MISLSTAMKWVKQTENNKPIFYRITFLQEFYYGWKIGIDFIFESHRLDIGLIYRKG
jgi:hypothetical protein